MFATVIDLLITFVVRCEQTSSYCNLDVFGCLSQTIVKQIEREETESD